MRQFKIIINQGAGGEVLNCINDNYCGSTLSGKYLRKTSVPIIAQAIPGLRMDHEDTNVRTQKECLRSLYLINRNETI